MFRSKKEQHLKRGESIGLILDIGSSSVGASLTLLSKSGPPRVLYDTRIEIPFQKELNFERFVLSMLSVFDAAVKDIGKKGIPHLSSTKRMSGAIDHVFCVYASPWYVSQTRVVKREDKKAIKLTSALVDSVVQQEEEVFEGEAAGELKSRLGGSGSVISQSVTAMTLDGYTVTEPLGQEANELKLSITMTMIAETIKKELEDRIARAFHITDVNHYSFALVGFSTIRDMYPETRDFLFIDVTGEVTDISLVREGALLETASFPHGTHTVLRRAVKTLGSTTKQAWSQIHLYLEEGASTEHYEQISHAVEEGRQVWTASLAEAVDHIQGELSLPHTIFLTSGRRTIKLFEQFLGSSRVADVLHVGGEVTVHTLDSQTLKENVNFPGRGSRDPFLAIESAFFNKLHNV